MHTRVSGYTLYELLLTLLLIGIVAGIGVPSFSNLIATHRLRVEINALFHAIHHARKASVLHRQVVSLCPSTDGRQCNPGYDWSAGWLMFVNHDADDPPKRDAGETLLHRHRVGPTVHLSANRRGFTLRSTEKRATNGTLVACDRQDRARPRALIVSYTGRPRAAQRTAAKRAYRCADQAGSTARK